MVRQFVHMLPPLVLLVILSPWCLNRLPEQVSPGFGSGTGFLEFVRFLMPVHILVLLTYHSTLLAVVPFRQQAWRDEALKTLT
jgi:hypothetical protein